MTGPPSVRHRRGISPIELLATAAMLLGCGTLLTKVVATGSRQWSVTAQRQLAIDLADGALERAWAADWDQLDEQAEAIAARSGRDAPRHDVQLLLGEPAEGARQLTAVVT